MGKRRLFAALYQQWETALCVVLDSLLPAKCGRVCVFERGICSFDWFFLQCVASLHCFFLSLLLILMHSNLCFLGGMMTCSSLFFFFSFASDSCTTLDKSDAVQLYIWHLSSADPASLLAKPYLSCSRVLPACHKSKGSAVRCMQKASSGYRKFLQILPSGSSVCCGHWSGGPFICQSDSQLPKWE